MAATDQQVQTYVDTRTRPRCEQIRNLAAVIADDIASIDDVYQALVQPNPTWEDNRTDGPPHLALSTDVTAWNTFIRNVQTAITTDPQWSIIQKLCVRPILTG